MYARQHSLLFIGLDAWLEDLEETDIVIYNTMATSMSLSTPSLLS